MRVDAGDVRDCLLSFLKTQNPNLMRLVSMKRLNILLSLMLVAGLFMGPPVFAQQYSNPPMNQNQPMNQPMQHEQMRQSINQPGLNQQQQATNFQAFNAKDLLGKKVLDQQGQSIGTVADLVIGQSGRADFIVLSQARGKFTPVPFRTFTSSAANLNDLERTNEVKTDLSRAKIDRAPSFASSHWKDTTGSHQRVCSYFGAGQCFAMNE